MDDMKMMMSMLRQMQIFGADPVLSDIMTEENIIHSQFAKNALRFISDIDFEENLDGDEEDSQIYEMLGSANQWDARFINGIMLGILISLESELNNPLDYKTELGHSYRLLNARLLEQTIDEC